ncbi:protein kinase domain-containing protein, partial [Haematococcus lacustris]
VWLAEWTGCAVAVKELTSFTGVDGDVRAWQEMQNEVHMLGTYNHPNIVRFMAICLDPPLIIMQFYPHGSLFDLLQRARSKNSRAIKELSWTNRLDMLRDVAAGMHYLHTRKPPVIHGDLRSPNLLLDLTIDKERPRFHVKIADFGLARMLGANSSLIMVSKTTNPRWTAPEVIRDSQIGPAGDVYSFAIVMWEMLTWQQPYEDMMSVQVIFSTVTDNYRPYMPSDAEVPGNPGITLPDYKALIELCWSADARKRPSFKQLVVDLQAMRDVESRAKAHAASRTRTPSAARLHPPPAAAAGAAPAHGMGGNSND